MCLYKQSHKRLSRLLLALALTSWSGVLLAQLSDSAQPLEWSADGDSSMRVEGELRILEMQENVVIKQGTLLIEGDTAVLEENLETGEFDRVTVTGTPVRYRQQLEDSQGTVVGSGDNLLMSTDPATGETVVQLTGSDAAPASIESPDSTMNCAAITYVSDRDLIREAKGPCTGSLSQQEN